MLNETKLKELFDRGLRSGMGKIDGQVCIEVAINLACGGDLSDSPPCVADEDRAYSIRINDAGWSSPEARAAALWPLALAQINTAGRDRSAWVERLVIGTVKRLLSKILRDAGLDAEADACSSVVDLPSATYVAAHAATYVAAYAAAHAAAYDAAHAAAYAADAVAYAAAYATDAVAYAASAASAADAVASAVCADAAHADEFLLLSVEIALEAYKDETLLVSNK